MEIYLYFVVILVSAVNPCILDGRDLVSFVSSSQYTPVANIIINEPLRPDYPHDPANIRYYLL